MRNHYLFVSSLCSISLSVGFRIRIGGRNKVGVSMEVLSGAFHFMSTKVVPIVITYTLSTQNGMARTLKVKKKM